ncbi:hypothetical protein IMCC1989_294 [gamma proteobacterium IMCC1989]|nr:hypothetical protein IMCC1989_294 [gamma proteobacterium IMCC1989]
MNALLHANNFSVNSSGFEIFQIDNALLFVRNIRVFTNPKYDEFLIFTISSYETDTL